MVQAEQEMLIRCSRCLGDVSGTRIKRAKEREHAGANEISRCLGDNAGPRLELLHPDNITIH